MQMALFFNTQKWRNQKTGEIVTVMKENIINTVSGCPMYLFRPFQTTSDMWQVAYKLDFENEYELISE